MSSVGAAVSEMPWRAFSAARRMVSNSLGDMDDRLGRNAAADQAGAAKLVAFDERGVEAELARADRGDIAARPAADDENLGRDGFGHGINP